MTLNCQIFLSGSNNKPFRVYTMIIRQWRLCVEYKFLKTWEAIHVMIRLFLISFLFNLQFVNCNAKIETSFVICISLCTLNSLVCKIHRRYNIYKAFVLEKYIHTPKLTCFFVKVQQIVSINQMQSWVCYLSSGRVVWSWSRSHLKLQAMFQHPED